MAGWRPRHRPFSFGADPHGHHADIDARQAHAHAPATACAARSRPPDPQDAKLEAHAAPPRWDEPKEARAAPAFTPKPALDPRAEKPPAGAYADGMAIADEQRARSAWIEAHGDKAYHEADRRAPAEERDATKQVPGVTPPTKRE